MAIDDLAFSSTVAVEGLSSWRFAAFTPGRGHLCVGPLPNHAGWSPACALLQGAGADRHRARPVAARGCWHGGLSLTSYAAALAAMPMPGLVPPALAYGLAVATGTGLRQPWRMLGKPPLRFGDSGRQPAGQQLFWPPALRSAAIWWRPAQGGNGLGSAPGLAGRQGQFVAQVTAACSSILVGQLCRQVSLPIHPSSNPAPLRRGSALAEATCAAFR